MPIAKTDYRPNLDGKTPKRLASGVATVRIRESAVP
jgi:hypothetical protein